MSELSDHALSLGMSHLFALGAEIRTSAILCNLLKIGLTVVDAVPFSATEGAGDNWAAPYCDIPYAVLSDVATLFTRGAECGRGRR